MQEQTWVWLCNLPAPWLFVIFNLDIPSIGVQFPFAGVEKIKEVKANCGNEEVFVLIMAGLTDVLIKSVEEGKSA